MTWDRTENKWSAFNSPIYLYGNGACYDSERKAIWSFGGGFSPGAYPPLNSIHKWDIKGETETFITDLTGDRTPIEASNAIGCGCAYDPIIDKIFVLTGDGNIYCFNPKNNEVKKVITTGAVLPNTKDDSAIGPRGKFQFVPNLGGVVIQPLWSSKLFFMRTH